MSDYQVISSQIDYTCPWFKVLKEKIVYPSGVKGTYYTLKKTNGFVGIIAINQQQQLIVLRQWRPSLKDWLYEIPMGGIDEGETPLAAAQREFLEESGYQAENWLKLGELFVGAGHTDQPGYYFLASDLHKIENGEENNPREIIQVHQFSLPEIDQMILSGQFQDGPSLSALALYKVYNNKNK